MSSVGIPDILSGLRLTRAQRDVKLRLETAQVELVTGVREDKIAATHGDPMRFFALEHEIARVDSRLPLLQLAKGRADAAETSFQSIRDSVGDLGVDLLAAATRGDMNAAKNFADDARAVLGQTLSALNVDVGGRHVFGGDNGDVAPLGDMETLLADVRAALTGVAPDSGAVATPFEVDDGGVRPATADEQVAVYFGLPFETVDQAALGSLTLVNPAGVQKTFDATFPSDTNFYRGGTDPAPSVELAANARLNYGVNADDPAIRRFIMQLSVIVVYGEGVAGTEAETLAGLQTAATGLLGARDGMTQLQSRLGLDQRRIEDAIARNQAERASFEKARADLVGRDQYEAATLVTQLETQLETIYAMTARTTRLSLLNYL